MWKFAKRRRKNKLSKNKCHDAKYTTAAGATTTTTLATSEIDSARQAAYTHAYFTYAAWATLDTPLGSAQFPRRAWEFAAFLMSFIRQAQSQKTHA